MKCQSARSLKRDRTGRPNWATSQRQVRRTNYELIKSLLVRRKVNDAPRKTSYSILSICAIFRDLNPRRQRGASHRIAESTKRIRDDVQAVANRIPSRRLVLRESIHVGGAYADVGDGTRGGHLRKNGPGYFANVEAVANVLGLKIVAMPTGRGRCPLNRVQQPI